MSNLEKLKNYNPTIYRVLKNSYLNNKIAHAYIFSGQQDSDFLYAPELLIEILISSQNLFDGHHARSMHNYPDLYIIDGFTQTINKDNIKAIIEKLQLTPLDVCRVRILYIKNIENASKQSLNSLLKFIENPHADTYVIMTTHHIHNVLSTIRSRAIEIKVRPISKESLTNQLLSANYPKTTAQVVATFANNFEEAILLLKNEDFIKLYKQVMDILTLVYNNPDHLIALLTEVINKKNYRLVLAIILSFTKDIIKIKDNLPIDNDQYHFLIEKYANTTFDYFQTFKLINQFLIMQKYHVNFNLAKNSLLLQLERCYE